MIKITPLALGVFPDIASTVDGWVIALRVSRGPLNLVWLSRDGAVLNVKSLDTGSPEDSTFPRLMRIVNGRTWLVFRVLRDGEWQAALYEIIEQIVVFDRLLGRCSGNNPVCLSADGWVAWQDDLQRAVLGLSLTTGEEKVLSNRTVGTGIARLDGETVVFIDEARLSVSGMLNPVTAHGCTVGEHATSGIAVTLGAKRGRLLPTQECMTPRVAADVDRFAAVTWGAMGIRVVLFTEEDVVEPPVVIVPISRPLWLGWFLFESE